MVKKLYPSILTHCTHEMNVVECYCWQWCEKAHDCPHLTKAGQNYQRILVNVDNQIRPLSDVRLYNGNVIYAPMGSPYYDQEKMGVDIPENLFVV